LGDWCAPGDGLARADRLGGKRGAFGSGGIIGGSFVALRTDAVAGALGSLVPDAGSGVAVRAALIVVLLMSASGIWWFTARRAALFRPQQRSPGAADPKAPLATLTSTDVSRELGVRGTFVQFSSATCATCPQVRRVLTELAASEPGVVHVDLPSEEHMDLVRRFSIYRTPSVLLLDPQGAVHSRTSGPLTLARALAALDQLSRHIPRSIDA